MFNPLKNYYLFKILFIFRERREEEREGEKHWCVRETSLVASHALPIEDLACAPTRNQTRNLSLCGAMSNPLSHTSQGKKIIKNEYLDVELIASGSNISLQVFYHSQNADLIYIRTSALQYHRSSLNISSLYHH